jgi:hypothetical protein
VCKGAHFARRAHADAMVRTLRIAHPSPRRTLPSVRVFIEFLARELPRAIA